jgi:hypothetical protein
VEGSQRTIGLLFVVAAVVALTACGSTKKAPSDSLAASVRVGSLVLTVPRGFSRYEVRPSNHLVGAVVADYPVKAHSPTLTKGIFPASGVALSIGQRPGSGAVAAPLRLPLSLNELQGPQRHADGTAWNGTLSMGGSLYTVSFWAGGKAPSGDRAALLHALRSIHHAR